jgi:uncharacterized membrane protein YccC
MLFGKEKNPKVMTRIGMALLLVFFAMNLLPHPTAGLGDLFDGVHGVLLGSAGALLLWAAYLNGQRRRLNRN